MFSVSFKKVDSYHRESDVTITKMSREKHISFVFDVYLVISLDWLILG